MVENLDEKGRENEEPSSDHSDDNYTEMEMEDSSNQAETSSEHEGTSGNKKQISMQYIVNENHFVNFTRATFALAPHVHQQVCCKT